MLQKKYVAGQLKNRPQSGLIMLASYIKRMFRPCRGRIIPSHNVTTARSSIVFDITVLSAEDHFVGTRL